MKKTITFILLLLFAFSWAWGKKTPTGTVEGDTTYKDALYNFQITALKNWKISVEKEKTDSPSLLRVSMIKKNYQTNPNAQIGVTPIIPTIIICAQKSELEPKDYLDTFFKNGKKLPDKNQYLMKCELLQNSEVFEQRQYILDKTKAEMVTLRKKFLQTITDPRKRNDPVSGVEIVENWIAGHLLVFKNGDFIYLVQFSCDREFFNIDNKEFEEILSTYKFLPEKK